MAIVDVEIPSGYVYTGWRFADLLVSWIVSTVFIFTFGLLHSFVHMRPV